MVSVQNGAKQSRAILRQLLDVLTVVCVHTRLVLPSTVSPLFFLLLDLLRVQAGASCPSSF